MGRSYRLGEMISSVGCPEVRQSHQRSPPWPARPGVDRQEGQPAEPIAGDHRGPV